MKKYFILIFFVIMFSGCTLPRNNQQNEAERFDNVVYEESHVYQPAKKDPYGQKKEEIMKCKDMATVEAQHECIKNAFVDIDCAELRKMLSVVEEVDWATASCHLSKKIYWNCSEIYSDDIELKKLCYLHDAQINKDESFCYDINDINFRVACLGTVAAVRDNFHLCGLLDNTKQRYNCVIAYATGKKEHEACSVISSLVDMELLHHAYNDPIAYCRQKVEEGK